jgi:hypothetical protein
MSPDSSLQLVEPQQPLVTTAADGAIALSPQLHPVAELLELSAPEVLATYRGLQTREFTAVLEGLAQSGASLLDQAPAVRRALAAYPDNELYRTTSAVRMRALFCELHEHVMAHPVWLHPFFVRFFDGDLMRDQMARFAQQYLNQVKNTRQCVALACGRFNSLSRLPFGPVNEVASEITQVVLAGLLADEYGIESTAHRASGVELSARDLLDKTTHISLYRQLFEMLDMPREQQDVPMLHGVADNVLTQRLLAGSERFSELESLASVGLGMEWGVPAFFSYLLGGVLKYARRTATPWSPRHVEVLTSHVRQDVEHAISVMLVTAMYVRDDADIDAIKRATNIVMATRFEMMTDIHQHVFGEPCASLGEIGLAPRYRVGEERIADALTEARGRVDPAAVVAHAEYLDAPLPFVA